MTERKHTPGPWRFTNGRKIMKDNMQIGMAWMFRKGTGVMNGILMSKAPELLDALEAAHERLCVESVDYSMTDQCWSNVELIASSKGMSVDQYVASTSTSEASNDHN